MAAAATAPRAPAGLSEDWLATLIGLAIVFIIGSGLLGPGAQNVSIRAEAGETGAAALRPLSGWRVSATLDGERTSEAEAPTALNAGETTVITCHDGALSAQAATLPEGVEAAPAGRAQIIVVNECEGVVSLTYQTSALVPWPVFNLFSR